MPLPPASDTDVVYYQAMSLDCFATGRDGDTTWLGPYLVPELGFHDFLASVRNIVMSRQTFSQIEKHGAWPYGAIPGVVVTEGPLEHGFEAPVEAVLGSPDEIVSAAKMAARGPTWIVGDAELAGALIAAGAVTRIDLFVIPVALGAGSPALAPDSLQTLRLIDIERYTNDVVRLTYSPRQN